MPEMPKADFRPSSSPRTIEGLMLDWKNFDPQKASIEYPWADRFVMGLPLAPWQRPFVWTREQSERFITSIWQGVYLGTYVLTEADFIDNPKHPGELLYTPLSNMVLEGQQRLKSIEMYLLDEIAVPDAQGRPTLWSEVDARDNMRFRKTIFTRGELTERNEDRLREFYDLLNFGGTNHTPEQRASSTLRRRP